MASVIYRVGTARRRDAETTLARNDSDSRGRAELFTTPFLCRVQKTDGRFTEVAAKGGQTVVRRGERVIVQPAGSGGYGDPLLRERERVLADVADGYITAQAARREYQVDVPDVETATASSAFANA